VLFQQLDNGFNFPPERRRNPVSDNDLYDSLMEVVKRRRTNRQFKPDPVPDEFITKIIEAARWAPSGFHTQPWEFVVVRKKEVKEKIVAILEKHGPPIRNTDQDPAAQTRVRGSFQDAPVFIISLCDWRARVGLPGLARESDALTASIFCSSMASAFLNMHLAAAALGLASQWYSAASGPDAEREIKRIIGIPEPLKIYDLMVVGYAAQPPIAKEVRELGSMIHYDDCGRQDFRTYEEVVEYAKITFDWCMSAH
jgi:nitroreductase